MRTFLPACLLFALAAAHVVLSTDARSAEPPDSIAAGSDYIFLIDTSYSMLLDPELMGREGTSVQGTSGGRDLSGKLVIAPPQPGQLSGGLLDKVSTLVAGILRGAESGSTVTIYPFDQSIHDSRQAAVTDENRESLIEYLGGIRATGSKTAIYDSVGEALQRVEELRKVSPPGRKAVIFVFTDGDENGSKLTLDEIIERYRLLRSDRRNYVFWRYVVTGGREKLEKTAGDRRALRLLDAASVQIDDLAKVDKVFEADRIAISPGTISLGDVPNDREWILPIEVRGGKKNEPVRVRLSASWRTPGGPPILIENEWIEIPAGTDLFRTEIRLSVRGARPLGLFSEPIAGSIRLTSPSVALFDPAEVTLDAALVPLRWPIGLAAALLGLLGAFLFWRSRDRPTVVVLSKSIELRRAVIGALEGHGFRLVEAFDAEDAREVIARQTACVVVTDMKLPNGVGQGDSITVVNVAAPSPDPSWLLAQVRVAADC